MKLLTNKKGFELSINFIVILIITLIVFGGSLVIASKLLSSMNTLKASMDRQTQDRLESMITSGTEEVVIAFNKKEVRAGETAVFGLGVLNTIGSQKNFSVNITPSISINNIGTIDTTFSSSHSGWLYLPSDNMGLIKNNDHQIKSLIIIPSKTAVPGSTYVFDVKVTYDGNQPYPQRSPVQKIRVTII